MQTKLKKVICIKNYCKLWFRLFSSGLQFAEYIFAKTIILSCSIPSSLGLVSGRLKMPCSWAQYLGVGIYAVCFMMKCGVSLCDASYC